MRINAPQTLRTGLAAVTALLLFAQNALPAYNHHYNRKHKKARHITPATVKNDGRVSHTPEAAHQESTTFGRVKQGCLDVHSGGRTIARMDTKDRFMVLERDGDSLNVRLNDGRTGTVSASNVTLEETRKPLPVSDSWSMRGDIVRTACTYRGARYRTGGTSASGFDCSGFVKFLYSKEGIKLPHSSRAQYNCGTPVSRSELRAGDMVFFGGTSRRGISHVGMYMSDGKFIHASTHRGGVRVDDLNAPYYRSRYVGARRPK